MLVLGINKLLSEKNIPRGDNMKKNKFAEFFQGKGYYVLLFVGVLAIAALAIIGSNLSSKSGNKGEKYLDLNEPDNNIVADDKEKEDDLLAKENSQKQDDVEKDQGKDVVENDKLLEFDIYTEEEEGGVDLVQKPTQEPKKEEEAIEPDVVETSSGTVENDKKSLAGSLSFKTEDQLAWPLVGNVIRNYSMDHVVYYPTLMQYKCSPAIVIDAEVGDEVKAAARGIVTAIENCEETGLTITTEIGDGYSLIYGQLSGVDLEIGDKVNEGQVIGAVAEPTKYYLVEGSNLYFQMLKDEESLNPMLFLE